MQIKLLGTLDYDKIKEKLENKIQESDEIIDMLKQMEIESKIQTVSTAGRLSRFKGDVLEILDISQDKTFESNINYIKRVTKMGHDSITDHDYLVFAINLLFRLSCFRSYYSLIPKGLVFFCRQTQYYIREL